MKGVITTLVIAPVMLFDALALGVSNTPSPGGTTLDYVLLDVGGQRKLLKNGDTLEIVTGDTLKIEGAKLRNPKLQASYINFVGFVGGGPVAADDTGHAIRTDKGLMTRHSLDGKGREYKIVVGLKTGVAGHVTIKLADPVFKFATVKINPGSDLEKKVVLRDGELFRARSDDKIKVTEIATNLQNMDKHVTWEIVPLGEGAIAGARSFELRFYRHDDLFAKIPMILE